MTMEYQEILEAARKLERKDEALKELRVQGYKVELTDRFGHKEVYERE